MKQLFEIDLKLKEGPILSTTFALNQIINGRISIKSLQRLQVDYIGYHLFAVKHKAHHGYIANNIDSILSEGNAIKIISTKYLAQNCLLSEYEPYRYTIRFVNKAVETYVGKNTHFSLGLVVFIKINKDAAILKDASFLDRFSSSKKLPKDGTFQKAFYLKFGLNKYDYQLTNTTHNLDITPANSHTNSPAGTFTNLLIFIFVFASITEQIVLPAILSAIVGIIALLYYYRYRLLGHFTITYEQVDGKAFLLKIDNDNWRYVKEMSVHYEIREEVMDSNTELSIAILYTSPKQTFESPSATIVVKKDFPEDILGTTEVKNASIYWIVIVNIKTNWGIQLPFEHKFLVRKKARLMLS